MCEHDPGCAEVLGAKHRNHYRIELVAGEPTFPSWPNEGWVDPQIEAAEKAAHRTRLREQSRTARASVRRAQRAMNVSSLRTEESPDGQPSHRHRHDPV